MNDWMWQRTGPDTPADQRISIRAARILFAVIRDLLNGTLTLHAMGLVYTTLLSIVPFLALSFSVLKGFGVHNQMRPVLESILADPLGDRADAIINNVLNFVDNIQVGVLGSVGLGFLVYTVIALVQKVERSFNEIWHVHRSRSLGQRFSNYLSVILIGPLLVFSALGATATVVGSEFVNRMSEVVVLGAVFEIIGSLVPYLMIIILFTFLYLSIPNTRVKIGHALVGGVIAGIVWQSLGFGFTLFVANSTKYSAIYSGFAIGIIMLIWLYLVWLILLVGAAFAFYSQHANQITRKQVLPSAVIDELTGLSLVYHAARSFEEGETLTVSEVESTLSVSPDTVKRIVDKLIRHDVLEIAGADNNRLMPARPLDRLSMQELVQIIRSEENAITDAMMADRPVAEAAEQIHQSIDAAFGERSVIDWVRETSN